MGSTTQLVETKDLAEGDKWIADFDFAGFADEIKILGKKLESEQGPADVDHLNKSRWSRFKFGIGTFWRRFNDWFDWMMPEAWNVEHNTRHHYNLSEIHDPDLVEENLKMLREMNVPVMVKYMIVTFFAF